MVAQVPNLCRRRSRLLARPSAAGGSPPVVAVLPKVRLRRIGRAFPCASPGPAHARRGWHRNASPTARRGHRSAVAFNIDCKDVQIRPHRSRYRPCPSLPSRSGKPPRRPTSPGSGLHPPPRAASPTCLSPSSSLLCRRRTFSVDRPPPYPSPTMKRRSHLKGQESSGTVQPGRLLQ